MRHTKTGARCARFSLRSCGKALACAFAAAAIFLRQLDNVHAAADCIAFDLVLQLAAELGAQARKVQQDAPPIGEAHAQVNAVVAFDGL